MLAGNAGTGSFRFRQQQHKRQHGPSAGGGGNELVLAVWESGFEVRLKALCSRNDVPGSVSVVKEREEFLQFFAIWLATVFTHFIGFGVFDRFAGLLPIPRDEGSAILVCDPALAA